MDATAALLDLWLHCLPGVGYRGVDLQKVKELVAYHLTNPVGEEMSKPPGGVPPPLDLEGAGRDHHNSPIKP